jgi:hypothetical protein
MQCTHSRDDPKLKVLVVRLLEIYSYGLIRRATSMS